MDNPKKLTVVQVEDDLNEKLVEESCSTDINPLPEPGKNPLLINTVIECVFKFLPFDDIKNGRLVSQRWNSVATLLLHKRSTIHFQTDTLTPLTFIIRNQFQDSFPAHPFLSFKFSSFVETDKWDIGELDVFFDTWGSKIKKLHFNRIFLRDVEKFDVTNWIAKLTNLVELKIDCAFHRRCTFVLQWDVLESVKSVHLRKCKIYIDARKENNILVAPVEIRLNRVRFREYGRNRRDDRDLMKLSDIIDLSRASKVKITFVGERLFYLKPENISLIQMVAMICAVGYPMHPAAV